MRAHNIPLIFKIAYPYHSLRDNCFLYFIFQKEVTLSGVSFSEWGVWGKAVIHNLLTQAGVRKSVPLTWRQGALTARAEPSCLVCEAFPILGLVCNSLFCFKQVHMTPWQPHCYVCSWQEGKGILCLHHRRSACRPMSETRCAGHGGPALTGEDDLVLSLSCVSEVLFCPGPMRVSSFLATLIPADHAVAWHPGTTASGNGRLSAVRLPPWRE